MLLAVRAKILPLLLVVILAATGLNCPAPLDGIINLESGLVTLHLENQSGLRVVATAEYLLEDLQVRETIRLLEPTGMDARATLLPTRTRLLSVVAVVSPDAELPENARVNPGDVLAEGHFEWQVDFADGDTLFFVIPGTSPPPTDFLDCNDNDVSDAIDIESGTSHDCNSNGIPDECDLADGTSSDCNSNGIPDECDLADGTSSDCNSNGIPDECDIADGDSSDCNENGIPDECDIADGDSSDCNENGIPDECDISSGFSNDCNENGIPDECDVPTTQPRQAMPAMSTGLLFPLDETFTLADPPSGADDTSSDEIELGFAFNFFGVEFESVYINANGNITFQSPSGLFTPTGFPAASPKMLAPFWADVDMRGGLGEVWYKLESNVFIVTWNRVGYYDQLGDKRNTFQVAISDGTDPVIGLGKNVAFSYGDMQWTTGGASGGVLGFGGTPATVGGNAGNGVDHFLIGRFNQPGSQYSGPEAMDSGVSFLDYQVFCIDISPEVSNLAPIVSGMPTKSMIRINPTRGDTLNLQIQFLSPEPDQSTSVTMLDVDNAEASGLQFIKTPGNVADVVLDWTPTCDQAGSYQLELTATDDFTPPGITTVTLTIVVSCQSLDCNANGTPDECEADCNENGIPDECDIACCNGNPECMDCNENGIPDGCDIASGHSEDINTNGIPDECEKYVPTLPTTSLFIKQAIEEIPVEPTNPGVTH